jgi:hypothetical protein
VCAKTITKGNKTRSGDASKRWQAFGTCMDQMMVARPVLRGERMSYSMPFLSLCSGWKYVFQRNSDCTCHNSFAVKHFCMKTSYVGATSACAYVKHCCRGRLSLHVFAVMDANGMLCEHYISANEKMLRSTDNLPGVWLDL